jgi:hypothetical protein
VSTIHDLEPTSYAVPSDDLTVAEAWASSPLGDPSAEHGYLSEPADFAYEPPAPTTVRPRSTTRKAGNAIVAAAVVGAIGAFAALGFVLFNGNDSSQPKPVVVVPGAHVGTSTPQAPDSATPPSVAPAPTSAVTSPDTGQAPTQAPGPTGGGDTPASTDPAPAPAPPAPAPPADPGTPPPAAPSAPPVSVNIPPVVPLPVPVLIPVHPGGGKLGGGQPGGGFKPLQPCKACHLPSPPHL